MRIAALVFLSVVAVSCGSPRTNMFKLIEDGPPGDDSFRVAVIHQLSIIGKRDSEAKAEAIFDANWRQTEPLIRMAADVGAKVIVTPEYGNTGNHIKVKERYNASTTIPAAPTTRPLWEFEDKEIDSYLLGYARLANELGIYIVTNALEREDTGGERYYYNTMVAFDPEGKLVARYRKINLYMVEYVLETSGDETCSFDTPYGRFGMLLCFDAIIPSTWGEVKDDHGVDFLVVASLWQPYVPLPGRAAMNLLANMAGMPVLWSNQASIGAGGDAGIIRPAANDTAMGMWGPQGIAVGNLRLPRRLRVSARLPASR
ncbi:MAG: carbon-nitrogen hydrolase family protein [Planctomycetota bacterium]